MKDNEVKEKLESLSPLAGGVVFGKEEAWDKLQARLEKKPARKIPLLRLSAAAILLLGLAVGGYIYYTHENDNRDAQPVAEVSAPKENKPLPQPITVVPETVAPMAETARAVFTLPPQKLKTAVPIEVVSEEPAPEPTPLMITETPAVANAEPVNKSIPVHKMRVVHINDVGKPEEETEPSYVYSGPALDLAKMKVVSLNDVQREESMRRQEEDIITVARINRPHGGFLGLTNTIGWNGTLQRTYAQNPLSIRLNRNN